MRLGWSIVHFKGFQVSISKLRDTPVPVDCFILAKHALCSLSSGSSLFAQGFFQQFWEKAPGQNWEKNNQLDIKIGLT